jgi:hypothetical protein
MKQINMIIPLKLNTAVNSEKQKPIINIPINATNGRFHTDITYLLLTRAEKNTDFLLIVDNSRNK